MRQYDPETGPRLKPEQKQPTIRQGLHTDEKKMISMLINSVYYFIECVFILRSNGKYRLVVLHYGKVLLDKYYSTDKGCRIAFQKIFKDRAWDEEIKPQWSPFYDPDIRWLKKKQSHLESGKQNFLQNKVYCDRHTI